MAARDEAVLLVGHGSRRERSNDQVRTLAADLEARLEVPVDVAFLELVEPSIADAIDTLAASVGRITVVPLALFAASHVKSDLPLAIQTARETHEGLTIHGGGPLGVHPALVDLLSDRVAAVEGRLGVDRAEDDIAVVVCARGSSDPDANGDAHKLARLLYEGRPVDRVETAFVGVTEPRLEDALHRIATDRPDAAIVAPYMLGDGVLTGRIREQTAAFDDATPYVRAAAGDPLGTDARLLDVLADRRAAARTDSVEMSCDTCKYKVDDEPHAHDGPDHHVAVCTNQTCAADGAPAVLERLRQAVRDHPDGTARITRTSCLGRCGDGPMVAVSPAGVWYGNVAPADADRIVSAHTEGRIVSDLVDRTLL